MQKNITELEHIIGRTRINEVHNNWTNIKNKCRTTVGKHYTNNEPTTEFKHKLCISEHSPLRILEFDWTWEPIKSWVATHWSRHKFEKFISTRRSDRTGIDRGTLSQDELVIFDGVANGQHLIDAMRKRLCFQASKETREFAESLKLAITEIEPEFGDVLVPNCVYRCGCPEFESCGYWKKIAWQIRQLDSIDNRYDVYNEDLLMRNGSEQ